jgi:lysophospholipase L1-like esterase
MRVVAFGDSITYGQHIPRDKAWPSLLGYVNKGVCADTTRLALERFPVDVQQYGAHKVLIQFGFNDCNRWDSDNNQPRVSLHAFEANLREMIARARAFSIDPVLISTFKTTKNGRYESDRKTYRDVIHSVAVFDSVVLLDPEPHITADLLLDDLHLNEKGHRVYAEIIDG